MKVLIRFAFVLLLIMFSTTANADFIGFYDVSNWTTTVTTVSPLESDASVDTTGAPASIKFTSGDNDNDFELPSIVDFTIPVAASGLVSFTWDYTTFDRHGSSFDPFGLLLNGVFSQLTTDNLFGSQSDPAVVAVNAGDIFGFSQIATDSVLGPGVTIVSNFNAPVPNAPVPEPSTLLLLGSGLAGLGLWRRFRRVS